MLDIAQTAPALQRSFGRGEICFGQKGLERLFQQGCAKILLPKIYGDVPEAVIVNSAGGLTGGDDFEILASVNAGAALCVTSQTAERVYRAHGGVARVVNRLKIGAGCQVEWLPQETILFDQCGLHRRFEVEMAADAKLLAVESIVLGRKAMGECLGNVSVNDQWRIWRDGKLAYGDGLRLGCDVGDVLGRSATFGGAGALANLVYVAPDAEDRLMQVRNNLVRLEIEAVASAWNGLLSVRFLAKDGQALREALIMFLQEFRGQSMPRVWHL